MPEYIGSIDQMHSFKSKCQILGHFLLIFFPNFRQSVPEYFGSMDQMHSFESKCLSMIPLPPNINVAAAARATFSSIEIWGEGEPLKRWNMLFTAKYFGTDCSSIFCCHSSAHEECLYSERLTCWEWGWKISRTTAYCFWSKSDFSKCFCRNEMSMKCFLQVSD